MSEMKENGDIANQKANESGESEHVINTDTDTHIVQIHNDYKEH